MPPLSKRSKASLSRPQSLPVLVQRSALDNAGDNGLWKHIIDRKFFRLFKRVQVQASTHGRADSAFYAPFPPGPAVSLTSDTEPFAPAALQFLTASAAASGGSSDLVSASDDFEMAFIGMNIPPQDALPSNPNELLLYSLRTRPHRSPNVFEHDALSDETYPKDNSAASPPSGFSVPRRQRAAAAAADGPQPAAGNTTAPKADNAPTAHGDVELLETPFGENDNDQNTSMSTNPIVLAKNDVPFVHYDPVIDGHNEGSSPDTFVPIPASKSVFFQRVAARCAHSSPIVPVRFTVFEIDKVTSSQARALNRIDSIGDLSGSTPIPYADIISSAVTVANTIGKRALKKYAKPDHVMSKDLEFRLVPAPALANGAGEECNEADSGPGHGSTSPPMPRVRTVRDSPVRYTGNYLRYGFYFFLASKVDAKLYGQTDASTQNVPILLRRSNFSDAMAAKGDKEYFPLTGVSYVVIKVSPGCTHQPIEKTRKLAIEHRKRLEHIMHMSTALEMLAGIKR